MASKAMVPLQAKGNAVAAGKQRAAKADGKNRRALGDIGNVVDGRCAAVEGKPQLQEVSRPITRSFAAQLLAKAQTAAATKKPLPAAKPVAQRVKAVRKKVTENVKVKEMIEKSPRANEKGKEKSETKRGSREASSKKKATLTSVLTSRSKYACGMSGKPKESDHDIDSADAEDQLAVAEYVEDIYKFYKLTEASIQMHDYMNSQSELNSKWRGILVDWLIEVHSRFELMPETLYLTVHIVDRYLSIRSCRRRDLQLVGMTAMLIACKYEEIWAPEVNDFVCISDRAYNREEILVMEKCILNYLEWSLTVPTPYVFLLRFLKAAASDKEMENLVFFLAEMSLVQYSMVTYCPSMIAASAVYAARCTLQKTPSWTETLKRHTSYQEQQLSECARHMVHFHATRDSTLKVVFKKYSSPQLGSVALLPPATNLLSDSSRDAATSS